MKDTITIDGKMAESPKSIKTLKGVFFLVTHQHLVTFRSLRKH